MNYIKYPRTFHLPWSEGATNDDKILKNIDHFLNKEIVVTEKYDGENVNLYNDYLHARSLNSKDHILRHWIKQLQQQIGYKIPDGWRICGENLYAQHSIFYDNLPSYFLSFSIWDNNTCLNWDDTIDFLNELNLISVPILYRGIWNEEKVKQCFTGISQYGKIQEGYVVRVVDSFSYENFNKCVAKFVRKNHIQTNNNWMYREVIKNKIIK